MGAFSLNDMTDSSEAAYQAIVDRLRQLRREEIVCQILTGASVFTASVTAWVLLLLFLEAGFTFRPAVKILLEAAGGLALLGLAGWKVLYPLLSPPGLEAVALRVENHFGGLEQRLISVLQLWKRRGETKGQTSTALIEAACLQAAELLEPVDLRPLVNRSRPLRAAAGSVAMLSLAGMAFGLWPSMMTGAAMRLGHPRIAYERPADTQIDLGPGDARVLAGDAMGVRADLSGVVPTHCLLLVRQAGAAPWRPIELAVRQNRAAYRFGSVTRDFDYRMRANDAETPVYHVTVVDRPRTVRSRILFRYPPHTGLADRVETEERNIAAPVGTTVDLTIEASCPLTAAWLDLADGERLPGRIDSVRSAWQIEVKADRRYRIALQDARGTWNRGAPEYRIVAIQDRPPEVKLLRPRADSELRDEMRVPLFVEAYDDYGLSGMEIRYRIPEEEADRRLGIPLEEPGARALTGQTVWDLSRMDLLPGDEVSFLIRAYDNNDLPGPGIGESRRLTLRVSSPMDVVQEAARGQDESMEELERIREVSLELRQRLEEAKGALSREARLAWQGRKELGSGIEAWEDLGERIERVTERLEAVGEQLEENVLAPVETLQKLQAVMELLSQVESPALERAAEALRQALEEVDPAAVREAIEAFQAEGEAFGRSLDRTIALLEQVRREQVLNGLVHAVEKLTAGQEDVVRRLDGVADVARQADRQDALRRDAERVKDELSRAAGAMKQARRTGDELDRVASAFERKAVSGRMAEVSARLRQRLRMPARELGQEISEDLRELGERLRETRRAFLNRHKSDVAGELKRALHDVISLSRSQEEVSKQSDGISRGEDSAPLGLEQARILSGANRIAERLVETSGKTFFVPSEADAALGKALLKMREAARHIEHRQAAGAETRAREAMGALNATGLLLRRAMADLASAASALGLDEMLEQLGELADRQGNLNARTEGLASRVPGAGEPGSGLSLQQLAVEQMAIQESLSALWRRLGAEREKVVGDMEQVASEMGAVADALERRRASRPVLERQRRILSRMLDAQRSLRQRGWRKERKARQGREIAYRGPGSIPAHLGESSHPLRERLREALEEGVPPEYHSLIRRYFENLISDAFRTSPDP